MKTKRRGMRMFLMNSTGMLASFSCNELMDTAAEAMKAANSPESGEITAPLRTTVKRDGNSLLLMPCLTNETWALKVLTLFPGNPGKGRPFLNGLVLLFEGEDGTPSAVMDGRILTALRTGSVGGLGVRTLSGPDVKSLGIIGAGAQGYWQVRFACAARPFTRVFICDVKRENAESLSNKLRGDLHDVEIRVCGDAAELVSMSEVIMTATTSRSPVLPEKPGLFRDRCFVGIGSYTPDMREYPDCFFDEVKTVFVDTLHALSETGDLIDPINSGILKRETVRPLSSLFSSGSGFVSGEGPVLFKSVGVSVFDLYAAKNILAAGRRLGEGIEFTL